MLYICCMPARNGAAHVVTTTRAYKDKVYRTHLLRRSYREDGKVKNETLGNLSHLPEPLIDIIRRSLQGETFVPLAQAFEITRSRAHGHVQAVSLAMRRLGFAGVVATEPCRERDLVLAMVASRNLAPDTKLATTRRWHTSTLAEEFGVADADEDDLYAAMDWLLARQDAIEAKLAARHLSAGGLVLYDLSSSYFEGSCCPLAKRGYSRDGKPGTLQVNYGLLTDARGCPVAVSVFEGNTADSKTFMPAVQRVRENFGTFRSPKTMDHEVRPIHHRLASIDNSRVRSHIFVCMLACYVEWHMRQAWAPLMFTDTEQQAKATRDPVAPAQRSKSAQNKAASRVLHDGQSDGQPVHSFATLLAELGTLVSNTCRTPHAAPDSPTFNVLTTATAHQQRALALINAIHL